MAKCYEVHTVKGFGEDLGVLIFENGEKAVYSTAKIAQRVADGMNRMLEIKGMQLMNRKYVVVEKEAKNE